MIDSKQANRHIVLTSHPGANHRPVAVRWGADSARERGPVIGSLTDPGRRNVIGAHYGAYALYRALAVAAGSLSPLHRADLTNTAPAVPIGPYPQWADPDKIVSMDPYGHMVGEVFGDYIADGYDLRPTIAVTRARLTIPELCQHIQDGHLTPDNDILAPSGEVRVTKIAVEPVWYLPGVARRCGIGESELRRSLFEHTGGMFPELITRPDLKIFLPPIGGQTLYIMGDPNALGDPRRPLTCRVHDECNGSDVFGSDICTCRPYLIHGIEAAVACAQQGGVGLVVYNRKEGRALGEVTKFLVYNARKRQQGGDRADTYFERTECVAGVQDMRFQELMPDVLHWLGISRIDRFISMSNMKYDALVAQGIEIGKQVPLPDYLVPADARVEIEAKKAAGYYSDGPALDETTLANVQGRRLAD